MDDEQTRRKYAYLSAQHEQNEGKCTSAWRSGRVFVRLWKTSAHGAVAGCGDSSCGETDGVPMSVRPAGSGEGSEHHADEQSMGSELCDVVSVRGKGC